MAGAENHEALNGHDPEARFPALKKEGPLSLTKTQKVKPLVLATAFYPAFNPARTHRGCAAAG